MPSAAASDVLMYIMTTPWRDMAQPVGWSNDETLRSIGLDHPPSSDPAAPRPYGLSQTNSSNIAEFIKACTGTPDAKRQQFIIDGDGHQTARAAYKAWYRNHLSKKVNYVIDSALKDNSLWPPDVLRTQDDDEWCTSITTEATPVVGPLLFGPIVMNGSRLLQRAQASIFTLMHHTGRRLKRVYSNARKALIEGTKTDRAIMDQLAEAVKVLEDSPTVDLGSVRTVLKLLREARKFTLWQPSTNDKLAETEALLKGIVEGAGMDLETPDRETKKEVTADKVQAARSRGRVKKLPNAQLADISEISATLALLIDHFNAHQDTGIGIDTEHAVWDEASDAIGDMGVEKYSQATEQELHALLDFPSGRPMTWSKFRDRDLTTYAWDDPDLQRFDTGGGDLMPLSLKWHQLVGVASIVDKSFFPEGSDRTGANAAPGMLLADGVGVGKTVQIMAYISFLINLWTCESKNGGLGRAKIVKNMPSYMGRGPVPNLPHLLVIPNTCVEQWVRELYAFNRKGTVDIFRLPVGSKDVGRFLKDPDSPWNKSKHEMINRIIITSESTFCTLSGAMWNNTASIGQNPPDAPRPVKSGAKYPTIYDMEFCVTVIDEIHGLRGKSSRGFVGGNEIRRRSRQVIGVSGTPYLNQPQDPLNIFRIIGIPLLCGKAGNDFEREWNSKIRRTAAKLSPDQRSASFALFKKKLVPQEGEAGPSSEKDPAAGLRALKYQYVRAMQEAAQGHLIRRTNESKKLDGTNINNLPPKVRCRIIIPLSEEEKELLDGALALASADKKSSSANAFSFEDFLIAYRLRLAYPWFDTIGSGKAMRREFPIFHSLAEYHERPASKLNTLIDLVDYVLHDDNLPNIESDAETGDFKIPAAPELPAGTTPSQERKIIIFSAFAMTAQTLSSALTVNGVKNLVMTGNHNMKTRDQIVTDFFKTDARVLILTDVGSTGLNLTCASIVIHFDVVWSGVYMNQVEGRCWRIGQGKIVIVYHLIAESSSDALMSGMASEKHDLLSALVDKKRNEALENFFMSGNEEDEDANDEEEEEIEMVMPKPKKGRGSAKESKTKTSKGKKSNPIIVNDEELTTSSVTLQSAPEDTPVAPELPVTLPVPAASSSAPLESAATIDPVAPELPATLPAPATSPSVPLENAATIDPVAPELPATLPAPATCPSVPLENAATIDPVAPQLPPT
ncbi:hypothetical protein M413DRAFT_32020, partial [Hebeloma cylindrosporum]